MVNVDYVTFLVLLTILYLPLALIHGNQKIKLQGRTELSPKQLPQPDCREGVVSKKECRETTQAWCKTQTCQAGSVGTCLYRARQSYCCRKYRCKVSTTTTSLQHQ